MEPALGSKAVCPHAILPISTKIRTAAFRDLIWVKQRAFEILPNVEEGGESPHVGDRTASAVGKPH